MTTGHDFDIGPLTWVKDEIRQALERAGEAITEYAASPLDTTRLKFCKTHLHQAHGALEIVGLEGVTRLTEECEQLLEAIEVGTVPITTDVARIVVEAFTALTAYLDGLVEGRPHQPVRLFPAYRQVMAARGAERILESDLFFPDLSPRPPRRAATEVPADMRAYVAAQRRRFQAGLLRWFRDAADNAALREMTDSVRAIERTQAMAQHRAFWWVTIAFTESLVAVGAQAGLEAKRLCARIDLQMKRLMEGSQSVAERLLRDTLYFVARSRVQSAQVEEVRQVYGLADAIPDEGEYRDTRPVDAELRALRETVASAKDKWNRFASGQAHELAAFRTHAGRLRERSGGLGDADFSMLCGAIASVADWVGASPARANEALALELATALLLAENALANFARPSAEFPQQVVAMGTRLQACMAGERSDVAPPLLDEISRRAHERLVMAQVVAEIRSNLAAMETALDAFFRDAGKRGELAGLESQSRQVEGALAILGADAAARALAGCRADIARFAAADYRPDMADFEALARTLSALGFFVEALQHGPAEFEAFLQPVAPRRPVPVEEETVPVERVVLDVDFLLDGDGTTERAPDATVEEELAAQRRDAQALYSAWRDKPDDALIAAELKANLEAIQQDADLVDEPALQQSAERALQLLDGGAGPGAADVAAAMAAVAPTVREEVLPAPSDEVQALARSSDEVVDAELLAVFLEEAAEVLHSIGEHHGLATAEPTNGTLLATIRRGFHTLKGSGRMVGLTRLGEAAWAVEQVMNQWLSDERPANGDLLGMVAAAHGIFSEWIAALAGGGGPGPDSEPLVRACERMLAGERFTLQAAVTAAPEAAAPSPDQTVVIGDLRLSRGLYGIFVDEAATHLETLRREAVLLATEAQPPRDEFVRAAHTLAGIAGTVSFRRLHELARAIERAALVAKSGGIVPEPDDVAMFDDAVEAVGELVNAVRELRVPPDVGPLEVRMEERRAQWLAASGEIDPALLHVEPPPLDEDLDVPAGVPAAHAGRAAAGGIDLDLSGDDTVPDAATLPPAAGAALPPAGEVQAAAANADADIDLRIDEAMLPVSGAVESEPGRPDTFAEPDRHGGDADGPPRAELDLDLDLDVASPPEPATVPTTLTVAPGTAEWGAEPTDAALDLDLDVASSPELAPAPTILTAAPEAAEWVAEPPPGAELDLDLDAVPPPEPAVAPTTLTVAPGTAEPDAGAAGQPETPVVAGALAGAAVALTDWSSDNLDAALTTGGQPAEPLAAIVQDHDGNARAGGGVAVDGGEAPAAEDGLSIAELRARGFDPAERLLERIQDEIDPQLLPIFLEEAAELMPRLGQQLRTWTGGGSADAQGLQRTLHTLKGSARMAGAMGIGQVAHSMEARVEHALGRGLSPMVADGLMSSYDRISVLLDGLRGDGPQASATSVADVADAAGRSDAAAGKAAADIARTDIAGADVVGAAAPAAPARALPAAGAVQAAEDTGAATLRVRSDLVDRLVNEAGEVAIARSRIEGELRALKSGLRELTDSVARLRQQLREVEIAAESQMQSRLREAEERHEAFDPLEFDRFTRFQEVARMMAESVNDVATVQQALLKGVDDADLAVLAQARLNRDLQGNLMRVRMVPFNNVAERLHRVVRQTAKELGKRANLDIHGVQTEIDRSVLDRMTGPFEHLLRNAVAHGIERAAERAARGKSEIGQIRLTARQEGNEFMLVFEDDGGGLDLARIRARAVAMGLARDDEEIADARVHDFIFMPGFSTADAVSAIAGRGVGMDVVRAEVAALGGRIDTESTAGQGTRFTIALPLTLAVTQVVMVTAGGQTYAVPSVMVEQVRQMRADELAACHAARMVRWQDREYPLHYLPRLLGDDAVAAQAQRMTPVLLMRSGTQRTAVHVDALAGNQEVVVKNIGPQLARVSGIAGATVLGDGRIVLILNPVPLAAQALADGARHAGPAGEAVAGAGTRTPAAPLVMVVDDSLTVRKITSRLLQRENYRVLTARDGVDALEQLQEVRPDILLVDIEMPRMDGFDLVRNVRADAALAKIPVIMITSRTAEKHRRYAMEVGVNMFLGKPYQEDALLDGIATLVGRVDVPA
ncbi:MAG: Hpt domain-containing protein [Burkholderiales bacterium]|nr:Hpt domain-containing protein [Burkholderiales bacterium]